MIRGFNSISSISSLAIGSTLNDNKYIVSSSDTIWLDLLVFNRSSIFNSVCTTNKYSKMEVINTNQTVDIKSQYAYIYSLYGQFTSCVLESGKILASGNCTYAIF